MVSQGPFGGAAPVRRTLVIPARKPMRRTRRVSLFEREFRVRLSPAAIEILFDAAVVLSEGECHGDRYYGSTMVTMDLCRASIHLSEACDIATARNVERLLAMDQRIQQRGYRLGAAEAERIAGGPLTHMQIDVHVHRHGRDFHLDIDVEAVRQRMP